MNDVSLAQLIKVIEDLRSKYPDAKVRRNGLGNLLFTRNDHPDSPYIGYIDVHEPGWHLF